MVTCYGLIIKNFHNSAKKFSNFRSKFPSQTSNRRQSSCKEMYVPRKTNHKQVTFMCTVLVLSFIICWLPFHAVWMAKIVGIPNTKASFLKLIV